MSLTTRCRASLWAMILVCWALLARGQMGQTPLPGGDGLVNQAAQGLGLPGDSLPGWMYYGVNAADRGLGYNGSYMTLGGFVPYAEDGLGGLWAADLRSHLSVNGGFFSNVGAVRKQFLGGTLLGLGVYWDYDGDLNQYPAYGVLGTEFGQFGHVYNQVGISGEWLTDYGNLRSNGYIPVGTTAYTRGAPGYNFSGNYLLCQNGLDAALGGADLEVGAYIPSLADWAGMISVGGYAYGNGRYEWQQGTDVGQAVVPWFGGVYTRLDMTLANNWDFSLRANNDSFFDWTGFARLTYRMGGSRRRNVPDQVEQPMMRNEHIVRAHQTPIVAINPVTRNPWNVIHVDNSAASPLGGNGTADDPFTTLARAQAAAVQQYDIVFVRQGISTVSPYESNWQFQADNQILVGQGSSLAINSFNCGPTEFFAFPSGSRPVLASTGPAITLRDGAIVDHFLIQDTPLAVVADASLTGVANVNDVRIVGTDAPGERAVVLTDLPAGGKANLFNMDIDNMDQGLRVEGGAGDVDFQGLIRNAVSTAPSVEVVNTAGGTVNINTTTNWLETPVASNERFVVPYGIVDADTLAPAAIVVEDTTDTVVRIKQVLVDGSLEDGLRVDGNNGSTLELTDTATIGVGGDALQIASNIDTTITVVNFEADQPGEFGVRAAGNTDTAISMRNAGITNPAASGFVFQNNASSTIDVEGMRISGPAADGIVVDSNTEPNARLTDVQILDAIGIALAIEGNTDGVFQLEDLIASASGGTAVLFDGNADPQLSADRLLIADAGSAGITITGNTGNPASSLEFTDTLVRTAAAEGLLIDSNATLKTVFTGLGVTDSGTTGVTLTANSEITATLTDLLVTDATDQALLAQGNDAASEITIEGASSLVSLSDAVPALESDNDARLDIDLLSLESAVLAGTNNAIVLRGTSPGFLTITESFLVANPTPPPATINGTEAGDIDNPAGVTISVP